MYMYLFCFLGSWGISSFFPHFLDVFGSYFLFRLCFCTEFSSWVCWISCVWLLFIHNFWDSFISFGFFWILRIGNSPFSDIIKKMHCFPGLVRNFIICSFVLFCWIFFLGFLQIPLSILFLLNNCFPGLAGNSKKFYNCCFDLFLGFFQFHYQVSFCWIISFYTITTFQEDSPICRYFGYNMK